jgi:two-component system, NtrC family, C4-dicarboxylate transport sensor histidine kinase DctB
MSGLQVGVEVVPSRREWVTAAARFFATHARAAWLWATFAAGSVLIMILADWIASRVGNDSLREAGAHRLEIYAAGLESELAKYEYLPGLLTLERDVLALLRNPLDADLVQGANERLERLNQIAGTAALYVLNSKGLAIAASNWNEEASFVGMDLSYRPYFWDAMERGEGRFYAIGTTSGVPGFYFSRALRDGDGVQGVGALKVSLDHLEHAWGGSSDVVLAIDANGVIFLASNSIWKFRVVGNLSDEASQRIRASRQYWNVTLAPLNITVQNELPDGAKLVTFNLPGVERQSGPDYLELTRPLREPGWHLVLLSDRTPVHELRQLAFALAVVLSAFLLVLLLYARQRSLFIAQSLAAKEALQLANDALEQKVAERTADLVTSNAQLQQEIAERHRAEQNLVQAGKLAVLGQMAAGITHELNQPLAALRTLSANAGTFLQRGRLEDARHNLQVIEDLTDRMGKITGQLKAFSRKDPIKLQPILLQRSITNTLFLLDQRIRQEQVHVTQQLPHREFWVLADATRLEQVLVNLIANAIDAMNGQARPCITIVVCEAGDRVGIAVQDNGHGIAEGDLSRLFEPFFTTKEPGHGLGLGLVISMGIAREFGGDLKGHNRPEGGAEFILTLQGAAGASHD